MKKNAVNVDPTTSDSYENEALTQASEYMDVALTDKAKLTTAPSFNVR